LRLNARAAVFACLAALAACAGAPRLEAPRVSVESVRVDRMTGAEAIFAVTLNLANPNARDIAVDAIDARLSIEDVPVGGATLKSPLRLPGNGEATATLQARAGLAAVLLVAAEIAQRAQEQRGAAQSTSVRYAVAGTATLDGGLTIPFSRTGEIRIASPAQR
jgi:LEA14-like dessication related protein